jgi:hypothetical protein
MAAILLLCAAAQSATFNQAGYERLKANLAAKGPLSEADFAVARQIHAASMDRQDIMSAVADIEREIAANASATPRPPHHTLDDYVSQDTTYSWIDMTGGTVVTMGDDDSQGPFDIGFTISYYGNSYTQMHINSNGSISPTDTGTDNIYNPIVAACLPSTRVPNNMMYGFWSDLDPSPTGGGSIRYRSDVAAGRFIVAWENVPMWMPSGPAGSYTFQIVIRTDGTILYNFGTLTGPDSCFVGIENATGTQAVQLWCCNQQIGTRPVSNSAVKFSQPAGVPNPVTGLAGSYVAPDVILTWTDPDHDTNGNLLTPDSILIFRSNTQPASQIGHVGAGVQTITLSGQPDGHYTYFAVAKANAFLSAPASVAVAVGATPWRETGYDWVDITSDGTIAAQADDINTGPYDLGFTFNYYDTPFTQIRVGSNGYITFGDASVILSPPCVPNTGVPNGVVYVFGRDLFPTAGQCKYYADAVNQRFIVSWDNCPAFGGSPFYNFQIILTSSGSITMNYGAMGNTSGVVGLENLDGSDGYGLWCNTAGDFTPGGNNAVEFWGGPLVYATVTGHVTLDGGNGNVTAVNVVAGGAGNPSVHPAANGDYTLPNVQIGNNRRVTATLAGYIDGSTVFNLDESGHTGADLTLRRSNPPAPTGLTSTVLTAERKDSLHWTASTDLLVDEYKLYRKLSTDATFTLRQTILGRTTVFIKDTFETDGVYNFVLTAVDTNMLAPPWVESAYSDSVTSPFGHLAPINLTANGVFDDRIRLSWNAPTTLAESHLSYDDGLNDVDGIGWWGGTPSYGWMVAHYQGNGPLTVKGVRAFLTQNATLGAPLQVGVFADDGTGHPAHTPLYVLGAAVEAPLNTVHEWTLDIPVTVENGSFFVGIRQMSDRSLCLGGDNTTPFITNTFFYNFDGAAWNTWEPALLSLPMLSAHVEAAKEVAAASHALVSSMLVRRAAPQNGFLGKTPAKIQALTAPATTQTITLGADQNNVKPGIYSTTPEENGTRTGLQAWQTAQRLNSAVAPHAPTVLATESASRGRGGRALDDIVSYVIFRDGAPDSIGSTLPSVLTYDNTGVVENQNHTYVVKARYDDGLLSPSSNAVTAMCNMAPGAPTGVTVTAVGQTQMRIAWTDPVVNADGTPCTDLAGLRVYRDGTLITATPVAPGVHQYTDTPPDPTIIYTWSVKAIDEVPNEGAGADGSGSVISPWHTVDLQWVDITTNGTVAAQSDDIVTGPYDLGFSFPYYGQTYTSVMVGSNGYITFGDQSVTLYPPCPPNTGIPNGVVYVFGTDLFPTAGQCKYYADAAGQRFIVSWDNCPHFGGSPIFNFQVILDANGGVTLNYGTMGGTDAVIGVENADGSDGVSLRCTNAGPFTPGNNAVQFWGGPRQAIDGTIRHLGGTNPLLENARVWVTGLPDTMLTDANGHYQMPVDPGTYTVHYQHATHCDSVRTGVVVEANVNSTINMSLHSPNATLSASSLTFVVRRFQTQPQTFTITNVNGTCPLSYQVLDSVTWITSDPASGTLDPNQSVTVTVTASPGTMQPNEYHTTMRVLCNAPGSPFLLQVDMNVLSVDQLPGLLPTEFALHANYPNPFNPTTLLPFDVPQNSQVAIIVYNVMGQEVATLVNGKYAAGRYQVSFDAGNLPSGLYLVKMTAGNYTAMNKMMLLK